MKPLDKLLIKYAKSIVDNINSAVFWVCVFLLIPFILYFSVFNGSLSHQSSDWAAFGSFIGGLVSPILTFITVLVLVANLHESRKVSKINKEMVDIAKEAAFINKEAAEISKKTADLAERQFQHNTLDNKIKTAITLTEKLHDYLNQNDYKSTDTTWLSLEIPPFPLEKNEYTFNEMCELWSTYVFESIQYDVLFECVDDESYDIYNSAVKYSQIIANMVTITTPDKLKVFSELISLIYHIEQQDHALAIIPKTIFLSIINGDSRYWLYNILIENKNKTLEFYLTHEWDDFISTPDQILKTLR